MKAAIVFAVVGYLVIGLALALMCLGLCSAKCGKAFLNKRARGSAFSNRTLIIVNNLLTWPLYFPSLLDELGIVHIPKWMNIIKDP